MSTSPAPSARPPPIPVRLFVIVLAIAIVLTLLILYLGLSGRLDTGIPGQKSPPAHNGATDLRAGAPTARAGAIISFPAAGLPDVGR